MILVFKRKSKVSILQHLGFKSNADRKLKTILVEGGHKCTHMDSTWNLQQKVNQIRDHATEPVIEKNGDRYKALYLGHDIMSASYIYFKALKPTLFIFPVQACLSS